MRPGGDQYNPPLVRFTHRFRSIDDRQVNLWLTEIYYDSRGGAPHPPRGTESGYPAKIPVSAVAPAAQSGQETLTIAGRSINTRWQTVPPNSGKCPAGMKTWTSDEVPGGLVRKTEVDPRNCMGKETILESFEGAASNRIGRSDASAAASAQPAPAPAAAPSKPRATPGPVVSAQGPTGGPARGLAVAQPPRPALFSDQTMAMRLRYSAAMLRARRDQTAWANNEAQLRRQGSALPPDIRSARGHLMVEMRTVVVAMARNDIVQANQDLKTVENTLTQIEKFLDR